MVAKATIKNSKEARAAAYNSEPNRQAVDSPLTIQQLTGAMARND
jgi:hypothetical protein